MASNWEKGDVVLVIMPGMKVLGRCYKVRSGENTVYLEFPFEVSILESEKGQAPVLRPFGVLLQQQVRYLEIASYQYIHTGKARRELLLLYENLEKEIRAKLAPAEEMAQELSKNLKSSKILQFNSNSSVSQDTKNQGCGKILQFTPLNSVSAQPKDNTE